MVCQKQDLLQDRIARLTAPCPSHKKLQRKNFNILLMPPPTPGVVALPGLCPGELKMKLGVLLPPAYEHILSLLFGPLFPAGTCCIFSSAGNWLCYAVVKNKYLFVLEIYHFIFLYM